MSATQPIPTNVPTRDVSAKGASSFSLRESARAYGMVLALIIVWAAFEWSTHGVFLLPRNFSNLMRQMAVTGVLSVGMLMVIVCGQIDLSVGSLVGLTGMIAALVQSTLSFGLVTTLLAAFAAGLVIGCLQGYLTAYAAVPSFIVTLGGLLAWRGVTKGISAGATIPVQLYNFNSIGQSYLDRPVGLALAALAVIVLIVAAVRRNRARRRLGLASLRPERLAVQIALPAVITVALVIFLNAYEGIPVPVLLFLAVALAGAFIMSNTIFGRYLYAIGGNPEAARLSGINTRLYTIAVFGVMGLLAALAGVMYTARVGSASPDAGLLLELDAIAACVIGGASLMGGRGAIFGACLGALFMASLDNGMSLKNVPDYIQDIVKGGILVAAVALDMLGRKNSS